MVRGAGITEWPARRRVARLDAGVWVVVCSAVCVAARRTCHSAVPAPCRVTPSCVSLAGATGHGARGAGSPAPQDVALNARPRGPSSHAALVTTILEQMTHCYDPPTTQTLLQITAECGLGLAQRHADAVLVGTEETEPALGSGPANKYRTPGL